jgi:hypothetical protein
MSCIEVQARGVPVVWMAPPPEDEQQIVGDQRDPRLMARNADDYVALALKLSDPVTWSAHGETAMEIAHRFGDMSEQAALVEGLLRAVWTKARGSMRIAA